MSLFTLSRNIAIICASMTMMSSVMAETYLLTRTSPNREPINFMDEKNSPTGFEEDIVKEIIKHSDIEIEEEFVDSLSQAIGKLNANETDMVISALSITPDRLQVYNFSKPYFTANPMTVVSKYPEIKSFPDLKNKTVSVRAGSTHEKLVQDLQKEYPDTKILSEDTSFLAVRNVIQGKADAVIGDDSYMVNFAKRYKDYDLTYIIDKEFGAQDYGILIAKDNKALKAKIDKALDDMKTDGTYDQILNKWYPKN